MDIGELTQTLVKPSENNNRTKYVPWWNETKPAMYRYDMFTDAEIAEVNAAVADAPTEKLLEPVGTYKYTLFHLLVWFNFYDAVKSVIARNNCVDVTDGGGKQITPLMLACQRSNFAMTELLAGSGADALRADSNGNTCWHYLAGKHSELAYSVHSREASNSQRIQIAGILGNNSDAENKDGITPLVALIHGSSNEISCLLTDYLLCKGARTDYRNEDGDTLLTVALKKNHYTAALRLAAVKSLVNEKGANGETPLRIAENMNKTAVCVALKENGAAGEGNYNRMTASELHRATCNSFFWDDKDILAPALYLTQKLINAVDEDDDDEVRYVADVMPAALIYDKNCTVLDMILKAGISLTNTFISGGGSWCLRDKCFSVRVGVNAIKKLIALGIDINSAVIDGKTPLNIIASEQEPRLLRDEKFTYFEDAAQLFDIDSATVLDNSGKSAMHAAARQGHTEMLKVMAGRGADVNVTQDAPAKAGNTPLHVACEQGMTESAKVLLSLGADDSLKNVDGETAAHILVKKKTFGSYEEREAAEKNSMEILPLLKTLDEPRNDGLTPLMLLQYGNFNSVTAAQPALISGGADVNRKDSRGKTALIIAAYEHCNKDAVKELVRAGADVNAADMTGATALHYALRHGSSDVARYLIKKGADYNRADNNGVTPATLAAEKGYDTVLELMTDIR